MPSERTAAQLRSAPEFAGASAIHPGVGLVWLSAGAEAPFRAASIIGWSQAVIDEEAFTTGQFSQLIASAADGREFNSALVVHVVCPGRKGIVDHLAATAPIHLVETIIETGPPGIHVLIVKGFGPSTTCLLVDKPVAGG
jgi:hypothetical protein